MTTGSISTLAKTASFQNQRRRPREIGMKLRIKGNSIRFRLLQSEVTRFAANSVISEEVRFGTANDQVFRYSIAASDGIEETTVEFGDNQILVLLPESVALSWTTSQTVGIHAVIDVDENDKLNVLIEKDFGCLDRPDDPGQCRCLSKSGSELLMSNLFLCVPMFPPSVFPVLKVK